MSFLSEWTLFICKGLIVLFPPSAQVTLIISLRLSKFYISPQGHLPLPRPSRKNCRTHFTGSPPLCLVIDCNLSSFANPSLKLLLKGLITESTKHVSACTFLIALWPLTPYQLFCLPVASFGSMRNLLKLVSCISGLNPTILFVD